MKLDRLARKELHDALLAAYPSWNTLAQMVRFGLDENLAAITGAGNLASAVFELIEWAEARGQLDALLDAALDANPGNAALRTLGEKLGKLGKRPKGPPAGAPARGFMPDIHELHRAAVSAGLTNSRQALLAGLPSSFVASLSSAPSPGAQLLVDLSSLDVKLVDGTDPLAVWLRNAVLLAAPRPEAEIFRRALASRGATAPAAGETAPVAPASVAAEPTGLTRRTVRNLVNEILRNDSDLNAFCLDFFDDVHARFYSGMDRVAKVDLLLVHAQLDQIVRALRENYPNAFARHAAHLPGASTSTPAVAQTHVEAALPPPAAASSTDPALPEIQDAYAGGSLVVVAGAAISLAAGLPSRRRLVELLADRVRAHGVSPAKQQEIAELIGVGKLVDALSAIKLCLGPTEFGAAIERLLDDSSREVPEVAKAITALAPRLRAVLTTNVDHLLERAFAGTWPALARAPGDLAQRRGYVLKLHGTLLDRSTWIFTRDDYERAMYASPASRSAFSALFHACPLLFVGYDLADDDLDEVLASVRSLAGEQPPRHFALAAADSITPLRRARLDRAGVRLVAYANPDGKHGEVAGILRWIGAST